MKTTKLTAVLASGVVLAVSALAWQVTSPARERSAQNKEAKDALEGKAPPALELTEWMNTDGKPLTWNGLKGKVVLIDFWAYW